jgi:hypothetical protein
MDPRETRDRILEIMNGIPEEKLYPLDPDTKDAFDDEIGEIEDVTGLFLRTPRCAEFPGPLPGLLVCLKDKARLLTVRGLQEVIFLAAPCGRGVVYIGKVVDPPRKRRAPGAPELAPENMPVLSYYTLSFDIANRTSYYMPAGHWAVMLIERDWISNIEQVEFADPEAAGASDGQGGYFLEEAAELAARIEALRGTPEEAIRFAQTGMSPRVAGEGVRVSIPERILMEGGGAARGALKLRARPEWIVQLRRRHEEAPQSQPFQWTPQTRREMPAAIVSGALVFAQAKVANPRRINLQIPIFSDHDIEPGALLEGYFEADLSRALTEPLRPATYWLYFVVGPFVDGPHEFVVPPPERT